MHVFTGTGWRGLFDVVTVVGIGFDLGYPTTNSEVGDCPIFLSSEMPNNRLGKMTYGEMESSVFLHNL
jgi:hypothetical protein